VQPGNPYTLTDGQMVDAGASFRNAANDLMTGNQSPLGHRFEARLIASNDLQVRMTDTAGLDLDLNLVRRRIGNGHVLDL